MSIPSLLESDDWRERLEAVRDLGRTHSDAPEALESLLNATRDKVFAVAYEAARSLAILGDRSVLPRLIEARQAIVSEMHATGEFIDTSDRSVENALTMAIIALLSPQEAEKLAETGNEFEKYMVRRKASVSSIEEYWGPIQG
jgi:hypothetical protein